MCLQNIWLMLLLITNVLSASFAGLFAARPLNRWIVLVRRQADFAETLMQWFSKQNKNKLRGLSPRVNCTDQAPLVGEVSANFCG
jgi:hypothetical protein